MTGGKERKNKKTSPAWRHFIGIDDNVAQCNHCKQKFSYRSTTTNLIKHLKRKHPSLYSTLRSESADVVNNIINDTIIEDHVEDTATPPDTVVVSNEVLVIHEHGYYTAANSFVMESTGIEVKVGFIGAGNMAYAIAQGLINSYVVAVEKIHASAPSMTNLQKMKDLGCHTTHDNNKVVDECNIIILCVKPHLAIDVIKDLKLNDKNQEEKVFVSVISGVPLKVLERFFPKGTPIIRSMPNIPLSVGAGAFAYTCGTHVTSTESAMVQQLFSHLGLCEQVPENLLNTICGLSGSGPAYVYTVIQAMSDGAVKMGLPRALATKFSAQAVMGASKMVLTTGKHPDVLRDEVCSPGGTTITGLHALERAGVRSAFMDAVEAATLKAQQQSESSSE